MPHRELLAAVLKRRGIKADEFATSPVAANHADGSLVAWAMLDFEQDAFCRAGAGAQGDAIAAGRTARPVSPSWCRATRRNAAQAAEAAVYAAWVNGAPLPVHKKKDDQRKPLQKIALYGLPTPRYFDALKAQAEGNLLCRTLTVLPPNELTPGMYRERIKKLAQEQGWKHEEFDVKELRKMGAGAFVAVAQGSHDGGCRDRASRAIAIPRQNRP